MRSNLLFFNQRIYLWTDRAGAVSPQISYRTLCAISTRSAF
jgi:hypothetical protein